MAGKRKNGEGKEKGSSHRIRGKGRGVGEMTPEDNTIALLQETVEKGRLLYGNAADSGEEFQEEVLKEAPPVPEAIQEDTKLLETDFDEVVWKYDKRGTGLVGFTRANEKVRPSWPNASCGEAGIVREKDAKFGQREIVVIVEEDEERVAYPANLGDGESPFLGIMPGMREPCELEWVEDDGDVIAISWDSEGETLEVLQGHDNKMRNFSPNPTRTGQWRRGMIPGDKSLCWIGWKKEEEGWTGYAYPVAEEPAHVEPRRPERPHQTVQVQLPPVQPVAERVAPIAPAPDIRVICYDPQRIVMVDGKQFILSVPESNITTARKEGSKLIIEISL